jgi:GNAT superfamily N-acetyltransferase
MTRSTASRYAVIHYQVHPACEIRRISFSRGPEAIRARSGHLISCSSEEMQITKSSIEFSLEPSCRMTCRRATLEDCSLLADLNYQLIRDEGHRSHMTVPELSQRLKEWLKGEYTAILFEHGAEVLAYALFRDEPEELYLRQFFVAPHRRRQGIGRRAMQILFSEVWPRNKRLTVDVLVTNKPAVAFWRAIGYSDYSLTLEILSANDSTPSSQY